MQKSSLLTKIPNAPSSSNPVYIFLNASWHVKVYDMLYVINVKPTCCNLQHGSKVCGDKYAI